MKFRSSILRAEPSEHNSQVKIHGRTNAGNKSFPLPGAPETHDRALSMKIGVVCWAMVESQRIINVGDCAGHGGMVNQGVMLKKYYARSDGR